MSINISNTSFVRKAVGKRDGIGSGALFLRGSGVSCSIANNIVFLQNLAAGVGGTLVVANKTNVSIEQALGSILKKYVNKVNY